MSESFVDLFESASDSSLGHRVGELIKGEVVAVYDNYVLVDAGLKSEALISVSQFKNLEGELTVKIGDFVDVVLEDLEDGYGSTVLSREKAKLEEIWRKLQEYHDNQTTVMGIVTGRVKGGFTVDLEDIQAFLPGSLVDVRPVKDITHLEGRPVEMKVVKLEQKRNNVVVSRRAWIESENQAEREEIIANMQEGAVVKGIVKNLTDYGAFVDLGGVDGLLHITDMAWKRIQHPSDLLNIGDEIDVKVLKFDMDKSRISLGSKQLSKDPWLNIQERYPIESKSMGVVTNLTDYGCFVELENGIEGLVHVSEMDWTSKKNVHPSKIVSIGDNVEVMVLEIDEHKRRISLGLKQCKVNPWIDFEQKHQRGEVIKGKIKSITDFGLFIGLDGNIDGLVHFSDISWNEPSEVALKRYAKGDDIEAVVLQIDSERERISLGIKQLEGDPFSDYTTTHARGQVVKGKVISVNKREAEVELAESVIGYLKASEFSVDRIEDLSEHLSENSEIEAKIVNIDKKSRSIALSIKAKDFDDEREVLEDLNKSSDNLSMGSVMQQAFEDARNEDK